MATTPDTSSSTSNRYRCIIADQRSTDSQESNKRSVSEVGPDRSDPSGEVSISTGSSESYYLILDPQYNNEDPISTPPPIASPPSDASYDDSFIEMVKQTVQRARMNYAKSNPNENDDDDTDSIFNYLNSEASIVLSSQDTNQPNNNDNDVDDEARVEQPRRAIDLQYNETIPQPYHTSSQKSLDTQTSLPEFVVIKKNPSTVNQVEYVTNKKPEREENEKEARAAADARLYFEQERDLFKEAIKELTGWQQEEEESRSSKDYSSWLCFDNENEVAQFKDIVYNKNSENRVVTTEQGHVSIINSTCDAVSPISANEDPVSLSSLPQRPCSLSPQHRYSPPTHQSCSLRQKQSLAVSSFRDQPNQKQSIYESDSLSLGSFRDKIVMQSTPVQQRQPAPRPNTTAANIMRPIVQRKNTSEKKESDGDLLFVLDQEAEERRAALFNHTKEPQIKADSPPRQPFFNLRR